MFVVEAQDAVVRAVIRRPHSADLDLCFPVLVIEDDVVVVKQVFLNCLPLAVRVSVKLGPGCQVEFLAIQLCDVSVVEKAVLDVIAVQGPPVLVYRASDECGVEEVDLSAVVLLQTYKDHWALIDHSLHDES